jgi:chromosome partitioning protein
MRGAFLTQLHYCIHAGLPALFHLRISCLVRWVMRPVSRDVPCCADRSRGPIAIPVAGLGRVVTMVVTLAVMLTVTRGLVVVGSPLRALGRSVALAVLRVSECDLARWCAMTVEDDGARGVPHMAELVVEDLSRLRNRSVLAHVQATRAGNLIVVVNGKGGVGKSSTAANTAEALAYRGERVLLVEMDPQANTAEDLGFTADTSLNDQGKTQAEAVLHCQPLEPSGLARPNLWVSPGGRLLEQHVQEELYCQRRLARVTGDNTWMFMYAASLKAAARDYNWVILDVAPGSSVLQVQAMVAADYVVVPTRSDQSSRKGLITVAARIGEARPFNPDLSFLGVALFATGSGSTAAASDTRTRRRIQDQVRQDLVRDLNGAAPIFDASIRHHEAAAQACRMLGITARELARYVPDPASGRHGRPTPNPAVIKAAAGLASDYRELATEMLVRIAEVKNSRRASA